MPAGPFGIALRKTRHDADGERFVVLRRDREGNWIRDESGELDGEAIWGVLADHGVWAERIGLLLDTARTRFLERAKRRPAAPERDDRERPTR